MNVLKKSALLLAMVATSLTACKKDNVVDFGPDGQTPTVPVKPADPVTTLQHFDVAQIDIADSSGVVKAFQYNLTASSAATKYAPTSDKSTTIEIFASNGVTADEINAASRNQIALKTGIDSVHINTKQANGDALIISLKAAKTILTDAGVAADATKPTNDQAAVKANKVIADVKASGWKLQ